MNRRKFMQGIFVGIATVAIASRLAPEFPKAEEWKTYSMGYTITEESMEDTLYGEIGQRYANALAQSMMKTNARFVGYR